MGASRPFFMMATVHDKEKQLHREITRTVTQGLPGVEVLAVPGGELGRGRGGPRCMSCPIERDA